MLLAAGVLFFVIDSFGSRLGPITTPSVATPAVHGSPDALTRSRTFLLPW
jgi:hypothetical protein